MRSLKKKFYAAMDNDFNTPVAMSVLFDLAHHVQRLREQNKLEEATGCCNTLKKLGETFGMLQKDPKLYFQSDSNSVDVEKIESLITARNEARDEKNWGQADKIRDKLVDMGILIEDTSTGTVWRQQ